MASTFNNAAVQNLGTSYSTIYTAPNAVNNTAVIHGLTFANKSNYIRYVDFKIQNSSSVDKAIVGLNIPIPGGSTLTFPAKLNLLQNEKLLAKCDTASSVDVFVSILENT